MKNFIKQIATLAMVGAFAFYVILPIQPVNPTPVEPIPVEEGIQTFGMGSSDLSNY